MPFALVFGKLAVLVGAASAQHQTLAMVAIRA